MKTTKNRRSPKAPARLSPRGAPFRKLAAKLRRSTGRVTIGADDVAVVLQALDIAANDCEPTSDGAIGRRFRRHNRKIQGASVRERMRGKKHLDATLLVDWMKRTLEREKALQLLRKLEMDEFDASIGQTPDEETEDTSWDDLQQISSEVIFEMAKELVRAKKSHGKVTTIKKQKRVLWDIIKPRLKTSVWGMVQWRKKLRMEAVIAADIRRIEKKLRPLNDPTYELPG